MKPTRNRKRRRWVAAESDGDESSAFCSPHFCAGHVERTKRRISLFGPISACTAWKMTEIVRKLESRNPHAPVSIELCSEGGNVDAGLLIYDLLRTAKFPSTLTMHGECMSAATLVALGATHRRIMPHAIVMIHQLSGGMSGTMHEMDVEHANCKRYQECMLQVYSEHLDLTPEQLQAELAHDHIMSPQRAVEIGLAHEIVPVQGIRRSKRIKLKRP